MDDNIALGIDLGTTYSCVGVYHNDRFEMIPNSVGNFLTPSYVSYIDQQPSVGESAERRGLLYPTKTVYDVKRLIGRDFNDSSIKEDLELWPFKVQPAADSKVVIQVEQGNKTLNLQPEQISSLILSSLCASATSFLGRSVRKVVITVPAYFNDSQRRATKQAAVLANLEVLSIINEPTAAALCYQYSLPRAIAHEERNVVIFDIGGGTFDVSIVTMQGPNVQVLATGGDSHLGGRDFTNKLVNYVIRDFELDTGVYIRNNPKAIARTRDQCEQAKKLLSVANSADIQIDGLYGNFDYEGEISRKVFEDQCQELFQNCISAVEAALVKSKLDKSQIHDVVPVGGSSRIPKLRSMLEQFFDGRPVTEPGSHPDQAVAFGAALQAAALLARKDPNGGPASIVPPQSSQPSAANGQLAGNGAYPSKRPLPYLKDVVSQAVGLRIRGGLMSVIIKQDERLPAVAKAKYKTSRHDQTTMDLHIIQGNRKHAKDNQYLGQLNITGLPKQARGEQGIEVTYSMNEQGLLQVTAENKTTNRVWQLNITSDAQGMDSSSQVIKEDEQKLQTTNARLQLENCALDLLDRVKYGDLAQASEVRKGKITGAAKIAVNFLSDYKNATIKEYEDQYTKLQLVVKSTVQKTTGSISIKHKKPSEMGQSTNNENIPIQNNHNIQNYSRKQSLNSVNKASPIPVGLSKPPTQPIAVGQQQGRNRQSLNRDNHPRHDFQPPQTPMKQPEPTYQAAGDSPSIARSSNSLKPTAQPPPDIDFFADLDDPNSTLTNQNGPPITNQYDQQIPTDKSRVEEAPDDFVADDDFEPPAPPQVSAVSTLQQPPSPPTNSAAIRKNTGLKKSVTMSSHTISSSNSGPSFQQVDQGIFNDAQQPTSDPQPAPPPSQRPPLPALDEKIAGQQPSQHPKRSKIPREIEAGCSDQPPHVDVPESDEVEIGGACTHEPPPPAPSAPPLQHPSQPPETMEHPQTDPPLQTHHQHSDTTPPPPSSDRSSESAPRLAQLSSSLHTDSSSLTGSSTRKPLANAPSHGYDDDNHLTAPHQAPSTMPVTSSFQRVDTSVLGSATHSGDEYEALSSQDGSLQARTSSMGLSSSPRASARPHQPPPPRPRQAPLGPRGGGAATLEREGKSFTNADPPDVEELVLLKEGQGGASAQFPPLPAMDLRSIPEHFGTTDAHHNSVQRSSTGVMSVQSGDGMSSRDNMSEVMSSEAVTPGTYEQQRAGKQHTAVRVFKVVGDEYEDMASDVRGRPSGQYESGEWNGEHSNSY